MANSNEPVVLELAPLPRDQIGPFLLLGLDKDAEPSEIEKHWAQRVLWARKNQIRIQLEDVNWAREALREPDKRVRHDVSSLNADTTEGVLRQLTQRYGGSGPASGSQGWQPLDREKDLREYEPPGEVPDADGVRAAIILPEIPEEVPAVAVLLEQAVRQPLDPWDLALGS